MTKADKPRPLDGIQVAIEDLHPVKGEIPAFWSKIFEHSKPVCTALTVNDRGQDD